MEKRKKPKTSVDEGIIELTEIVAEEDGGADDAFMKELEKESDFDDASSGAADDEVSDFFSSPAFEPAAKPAPPTPPTPPAPPASAEDDFDSFLNDLEAGLEEEQTETAKDTSELAPDETLELIEPLEAEDSAAGEEDYGLLEEPEEPKVKAARAEEQDSSFLEKQWEEALDEPPAETEPGSRSEAQPSFPAGRKSGFGPEQSRDELSVLQPAAIQNAFSEDMLRGVVEKAVRDVLEPIAERVFTEVAGQVITREIERLRKEIEELEEDGS